MEGFLKNQMESHKVFFFSKKKRKKRKEKKKKQTFLLNFVSLVTSNYLVSPLPWRRERDEVEREAKPTLLFLFIVDENVSILPNEEDANE